MSIQFRSRIGEAINSDILQNQGLCCKGNDLIGSTGEYGYHSCFATGGQYFPYLETIYIPALNRIRILESCEDKNPRNR